MARKEMKYTDYVESWYRVWCPYCEMDNWYCNGNEQDLSGIDVETIKCRNCKEVFRLGSPDSVLDEINGGNFMEEEGCKLIKEKRGK